MEVLKNLLIDSFNGFVPSMIPFFLFQLLMAALMGHLFQKILNKKFESELILNGSLLATCVTLLVAISKYSLPIAVLSAAAIILLGTKNGQKEQNVLGLFLICVIGIGCGSGAVIVTFIGSLILASIVLFMPLKK